MKERTIKEAIIAVLKDKGGEMTASEIYDEIVRKGLYTFMAKDPLAIVKTEIRRSAYGVELKKAHTTKVFKLREDGRVSYQP
jgi:hypothetical protein